jgi:hypothetical protein
MRREEEQGCDAPNDSDHVKGVLARTVRMQPSHPPYMDDSVRRSL